MVVLPLSFSVRTRYPSSVQRNAILVLSFFVDLFYALLFAVHYLSFHASSTFFACNFCVAILDLSRLPIFFVLPFFAVPYSFILFRASSNFFGSTFCSAILAHPSSQVTIKTNLLADCDHGAYVSINRMNQHGHGVCWSTGRKNSLI